MKQKNIFTTVVFENILKGFKATNLTTNSIIILLQELVLYTNKNILVSIENQEEAFDFYNKGQEHNQSIYTYFPESVGDNNVPGFEKENVRYQKESVLKTSGYNGVVCVGTPVSFKENIVPRQYKKDIKQLDLAVGLKLTREVLIGFLENLCYDRVGIVEKPNEYNFRGDVLDFFPPLFKNPVRVSFFFDTIESLCVFDPENQQPTNSLTKIKLKEATSKQTTDNINLIKHSRPSHLFVCDLSKGELGLSGDCYKQKISFSSVSVGQSFNHKNKPSVIAFLKRFNRLYYVSRSDTIPDFLQGFSVNMVYGSIENGFWSKNQGVLVLSENDYIPINTIYIILKGGYYGSR